MKKVLQNNLIFVIFMALACQQPSPKTNSDWFMNCMNQFHDEKGCREMLGRSNEKNNLHQDSAQQLESASAANLFIRKDLSSLLQGKNQSSVISKLGIPDEVLHRGDSTHFIYKRSITRYSSVTLPDKDFTVIFRRNFVIQTDHTPPD